MVEVDMIWSYYEYKYYDFFDSPWLERLFHGMELLWVRWCQGRPARQKKLFIRMNFHAMVDDNKFLDNIIHRTFEFHQKICGGQTSCCTTGSTLKKENWSLLKNKKLNSAPTRTLMRHTQPKLWSLTTGSYSKFHQVGTMWKGYSSFLTCFQTK